MRFKITHWLCAAEMLPHQFENSLDIKLHCRVQNKPFDDAADLNSVLKPASALKILKCFCFDVTVVQTMQSIVDNFEFFSSCTCIPFTMLSVHSLVYLVRHRFIYEYNVLK